MPIDDAYKYVAWSNASIERAAAAALGSMAPSFFLVAVLAATVIAVQSGGQLGQAAPAATTAEVFWRAVLPDSPLPGAILRLLRPAAGTENKRSLSDEDFGYDDYSKDEPSKGISAAVAGGVDEPRPPFNYPYEEGSAKSSGSGAAGARGFDYDNYAGAENRHGDTDPKPPFNYAYKSPEKTHAGERRRAAVGEPPFNYGYKSPGKTHAGERRRAAVGEPPFNYAYKSPEKTHAGERRRAAVGEKPFQQYAYDGKIHSAINHYGKENRRDTVVGEPPFQQYAYNGKIHSAINHYGKETRRDTAGAPPFQQNADGEIHSNAKEHRRATVGEPPFQQYAYKSPTRSHAGSDGQGAMESKAPSGEAATTTTTTVFFHEEAMRVGERLPFHFPATTCSPLGLLPRHVANSIPFTAAELPSILAMFGVAPDSAMAASMEYTLSSCDAPTIAGESKFCAKSLEALVENAMALLGTRDVRPLTSTLPRAGAPLQQYTVRSMRLVDGGPSFVACHDEVYPYTVYRCHTTGPSRAYMVEMEGALGGAVTVAAVCHTDTSLWNPEHVSFKLLGTKPGGEPVCHVMPYGHILWAKNVKRSSA